MGWLRRAGITSVSVRRPHKRHRRKRTLSPAQPVTKVSPRDGGAKCCELSLPAVEESPEAFCQNCRPDDPKACLGYCITCWRSWLANEVASRQQNEIADVPPRRCVECGADAKIQGTRKYHGLGYCVPCSAAYLKSRADAVAALRQAEVAELSLCHECGLCPGARQGKQEFSDSCYCMQCWSQYHELNASRPEVLCAECKVQTGVYQGRHEFSDHLYCEDCRQAWQTKPVELVPGTCVECRIKEGEVMGFNGFEDSIYCWDCWCAYHDRLESTEPKTTLCVEFDRLENTEPQTTLCVECKLQPADYCGNNAFSSLSYCEDCWQKWFDYEPTVSTWFDYEPTVLPPGPCIECEVCPGEVEGFNGFEGFVYCRSCWYGWHKQRREITEQPVVYVETLDLCSKCGEAQGEVPGTQDFRGKVYCRPCWDTWREEAGLNNFYGPQKPPRAITISPNHYDFIEVGTSTWGTLTQYCAGDVNQASALGSRIVSGVHNLFFAHGLAVEVVSNHLDMLPSLPNVGKVYAAMDEIGGEDTLFYVSPGNLSRYMGQYYAELPNSDTPGAKVDVMWYAMSLSRIGQPHPELEQMLRSVGRLDLLESQRVRVLSWEDLCIQHHVGSVDVVQIDCEGKDCAILRGMIACCERNPASFPRVIQFEANHLTDKDEIEATLSALLQKGDYHVTSRTEYNIIVQR